MTREEAVKLFAERSFKRDKAFGLVRGSFEDCKEKELYFEEARCYIYGISNAEWPEDMKTDDLMGPYDDAKHPSLS